MLGRNREQKNETAGRERLEDERRRSKITLLLAVAGRSLGSDDHITRLEMLSTHTIAPSCLFLLLLLLFRSPTPLPGLKVTCTILSSRAIQRWEEHLLWGWKLVNRDNNLQELFEINRGLLTFISRQIARMPSWFACAWNCGL